MLSESSLCARLPEPAAAWLRDALHDIRGGQPPFEIFLGHWSVAGRRLGPVSAGWSAAASGRALLLHAALDAMPAETHPSRVEALFRTGELGEQQALLRCLDDLPAPERFLAVGIEAVRSNASTLLEAIACDNPFPAKHFPEAAFNQMVIKCLFNALPLARIVGLAERRSAELGRMVAAYASERRAAGRAVAPDAALVLDEETTHAPV